MSNFKRIVKTTGKILKISCVRCHFMKFDISLIKRFFGFITVN